MYYQHFYFALNRILPQEIFLGENWIEELQFLRLKIHSKTGICDIV